MTDDLRELFVDVTGTEATTDRQEAEHSRVPIDEQEAELVEAAVDHARDDGLRDAVAGAETGDPDST